jgi:hypothetical protein
MPYAGLLPANVLHHYLALKILLGGKTLSLGSVLGSGACDASNIYLAPKLLAPKLVIGPQVSVELASQSIAIVDSHLEITVL